MVNNTKYQLVEDCGRYAIRKPGGFLLRYGDIYRRDEGQNGILTLMFLAFGLRRKKR